MGITNKYLTMEAAGSTVPNQGNGGRVITMVPTAPLAAGGGAHYWQPRPFSAGTPLLQPAVQHRPDFDHGKETLFAAPIYNLDGGAAGSRIEVLAIEPRDNPYDGVPSVFTQVVSVPQFHAVGGATEPERGGSIDVANDWVNKLVYSHSNLYLSMDDCEFWDDAGCALTGVRVIRLPLRGLERSHGAITKLTLSYGSQEEISGAVTFGTAGATWFGFPAIEVNDHGDVVAAYQGTSPKTFADARYSVWEHSEDLFRSSRVMKAGGATVDSWHHYLGMSVDSFDGTGVWMINGYGDPSKTWGYAFGKVLGKPIPDLDVLQASVEPGPSGRRSFKLDLTYDNLGDGDAPAVSGKLRLTRAGSPNITIKTFDLAAIGHGAHSDRIVHFKVPATPTPLGDYSLRIDLDSTHQLKEYDESNNRAAVALP